jgi:hypothetical protein
MNDTLAPTTTPNAKMLQKILIRHDLPLGPHIERKTEHGHFEDGFVHLHDPP